MGGFALKIKTKSGQKVINKLTSESTVEELKKILSEESQIPVKKLQVLAGFPPKIIEFSSDSCVLSSSGISSGDTLILEEKVLQEETPSASCTFQHSNSASCNFQEDETVSNGILIKHVVESDNSCLFSSLYFVLNGKEDASGEMAPHMRQLVAQTISSDDLTYCEAVLGKPNPEYCTWIQDSKSWGGAIELSILSRHFGLEIVVVDIINGILNLFGEDQNYPLRVLLLFDGIHYDPLYMEPYDGSKIRTMFPREEQDVLKQAQQIADEAKSSKQFTDVQKFTLKCMICNIFLKGQTEATNHAKTTGHQNFGEVYQ